MKRRSWMDRLSQAARWRLPTQEAEEVIADYQELLAERPRTEEELYRDLGDPVQAVQLLVQPKAYRRWKIAFCTMAACLLVAALYPLPASPVFVILLEFHVFYNQSALALLTELLLGIVLALLCFRRRKGEAKKPWPKTLLLSILLLLAGLAVTWWFLSVCAVSPEKIETIWTKVPLFNPISGGMGSAYEAARPPFATGMVLYMEWVGCALAGLLGTVGLVKARTKDRRWSIVYLLALTLSILSLAVLVMMFSIFEIGHEEKVQTEWMLPYFRTYILVTVAGLVGTGVSLC